MTRIIAGTPYIDPTVDHVDLKQLRTFTPAKLRRLQRTQVLRQGDRPVAVLLSFNTFLRIQEELETLSNRVADYEAEDLDPLFGGVPVLSATRSRIQLTATARQPRKSRPQALTTFGRDWKASFRRHRSLTSPNQAMPA